jgi:molecular chaperone GrpE
MDNVRKRAQADIAAAHRYALEKFALALLPIKDSLEATLATGTATHDALTSGVELTLRQLEGVFEKFSITEIHPVGEKFDPHRHQAMTMVESDQPVNTVVQVFQKGYLLFDRVIRPALVAVAKGKAG